MRYYFENTVVEEFAYIGSDNEGASWPEFDYTTTWSIFDRKEQGGGKIGQVHTAELAQFIVDQLNDRD